MITEAEHNRRVTELLEANNREIDELYQQMLRGLVEAGRDFFVAGFVCAGGAAEAAKQFASSFGGCSKLTVASENDA